ncbi:MAG TPA: hypothetical protein VKA36_03340 [Solirubrobacterales bacterium]|nr:hypothetical protein [Solirubrobacterales bacterium]
MDVGRNHAARERLRGLLGPLGAEEGVAVALVMMVMSIGLALAGVGSVAAMSSMQNASRDSDDKRAFAAAEAGIEQALLRQNKILATDTFPCLVLGATQELIPGYPGGNGWCPQQSGTVQDGDFNYAVKPATLVGALEGQRRITIVSEGTANGETRRVAVDAIASTGFPAFADASVVGLDSFVVDGNGIINADAGTNADIQLNKNAQLCGNALHGVGRGLLVKDSASLCSGFTVTEGALALSPPDPGSSWDENDNGRFFAEDTKSGSVNWDSSTRELSITGNSALTLGGATYSFCKVDISGKGKLLVASGAVVRIYFHSPEQCGYSGGTEQLSVTGNGEISATTGDAGDVGLLFVGSDTLATTVKLAGNGKANEMMVYAPRSDVKVSGNGNYTGAMAGKTFVDTGNGTISGDDSVLDFEIGVSTNYRPEKFIECVGPLGVSDPSTGC